MPNYYQHYKIRKTKVKEPISSMLVGFSMVKKQIRLHLPMDSKNFEIILLRPENYFIHILL